jgi:DNA-binding NtrC family response regulator
LINREVAAEILGESKAIQDLRDAIARVGPSEARVLIEGESGTGKELVARAIHETSARRDAAFVVVNCAAIPSELFESELFGHKRGAFTGAAQRRPGLIELAEGGTLFLDEVGELPLSMQPALLRVVQFGEYRPLGAERLECADVRFLTATNRDLQTAIDRGDFREDLYHRIAPLAIHVPPLRERGDDVCLLANHMLASHNANQASGRGKTFSESALARLQAHEWTGNVRELENVVVRLVTLVEGERIDAIDVEQHLSPMGKRSGVGLPSLDLETLERSAIVQALTRHDGNRGRAAAELGVATKALYNKIRHHSITASEWGGKD